VSASQEAEQIQDEMGRVRGELSQEFEKLVGGALTLVDWRHYVRSYPWACLAGAVGLGFMLVPKRLEVIRPDADALEELARRHRLEVQPSSTKGAPRGGLATSIATMAASMAVRTAMGILSQHAGKLFAQPDRFLAGRPQTPAEESRRP
jgi:hypothetical protein